MIDTHIHLLEPDRFTYEWTKGFPALTGRFDLSDYQKASADTGIQAGVFMEVDCEESADEARYFCSLAEQPGCLIQAVVAAARPESPDFERNLEAMAHPRLTGIRRVLHTQPDELSQSSLFRENVSHLGALGLSFDLCVLQRQLPLALDLVRACPQTTFILDHCGVPEISANDAPAGEGFLAWEKATGVTIGSGDALIVRTGRWEAVADLPPWNFVESAAGLHASTAAFLKERDVAVIGCDGVTDVMPSGVGQRFNPTHELLIIGLGMPIFDNLDLAALAAQANKEQRYVFMLVAAPLSVAGASGSPLNPLAIF